MARARTFVIGALAALSWPATGWSRAAEAPARLDLIASLNSICVAAQGDRARAAVLASEAGFSPTPVGVVQAPRNSTETEAFIRSTEADVSFVLLGKMTRRLGRETVVIDYCGVTARPTDHRALDARLRETMGFTAVRGGGFDAYAWLQTAEGRAPARSLPDEQLIAMARTGQMRMVAIDRTGPGSTLLYLLPRLD